MRDLEALARRARMAKVRLLAHGAPAVKITVIYDGHAPNDPNVPGMSVQVAMGPYLATAALEALADELDRRVAGGEESAPFPMDGAVDA